MFYFKDYIYIYSDMLVVLWSSSRFVVESSMFLFCIDGNGRPQTAVPEAVKMYDRQMAEGGEDEGQRKPSKIFKYRSENALNRKGKRKKELNL